MEDDQMEVEEQNSTKTESSKFQQELFYNKILPNSIDVQNDSSELLNSIKNNLARAVGMREINPGVGIYASKLLMYIKLYGLKFSKQDHIDFIKLFLEVLSIPNLEPTKVNKVCVVLHQLLRKTHLLSPDDVQIEWRPLYELSKIYLLRTTKGDLYRYFPRNKNGPVTRKPLFSQIPMEYQRFFQQFSQDTSHLSVEQNLQCTIRVCAPYFPESAAKEIRDEIFPQLMPLDIGRECRVFELLTYFLSPRSHRLWFKEFMSLWDTYGYPPWTSDIMILMSLTAELSVGEIDWTPYIPTIFTRILRSLDLPVSYKRMKSSKNESLCMQSSASWIVYMLGPNSIAWKYLSSLMSTIESYLHPANSGKWVNTIAELLVQLPKYFTDRLIFERYKNHPWKRPIPEEHRLTEDCITKFVECLKPVVLQMMYSRSNSNDISRVFKLLADLRPELIIPSVIERVYTTLDIITEPHKLTASLTALNSISNALATGSASSKTHIIPLLFQLLPAIDPNDFRKTSVTLQYFSYQTILIPFVDCSKASQFYDDLTEDEHLICEQTAMFEDFVLQYLDRIFLMIESFSYESTRMEHSHLDGIKSKVETAAEALIQASCHAILGQCSQEILDSATKKFVNYIKTHLFDPKMTVLASVTRTIARVNGKNLFKMLMPYLLETLNNYLNDTEGVEQMEKLSDEFLYHLTLLVYLVRGSPTELKNYIPQIIPFCDRILLCKCKVTNHNAAQIITNMIHNLSILQTTDIQTVPEAYTKPLNEFLPIRFWGYKPKECNLNWFVPGEEERKICEEILWHYLLPILENFEKYIAGESAISREEMTLSLTVLTGLLRCYNFLPNWQEEPIQLYESVVKCSPYKLSLGFENLVINMPDGRNFRLAITDVLDRLQKKILEQSPDDVKSLKQLIAVWERLYLKRHINESFEVQMKGYNQSKKFQEYKLVKKRRDIRAVVATRVLIQQDVRDELSGVAFTSTHKKIMLNLLELSVSQYPHVRSIAQSKLFSSFQSFAFSYKQVLENIVQYLQVDPNENHEVFKGALYLVATNRRAKLIIKNDWYCVDKLWLALLQAQQSEKLSILRILDNIMDSIQNEFQTLTTEIEIPDKIVELAKNLLLDEKCLTAEDIETGKAMLIERNKRNTDAYYSIIDKILSYVQNNSLHWRKNLMASKMIHNLIHPKTVYPSSVAKHFVHNLIHESIEERKVAIKLIEIVLVQQKREHVKIAIDPFEIAGVQKSTNEQLPVPGLREDNKWLQYEMSEFPKCQEDWDKNEYIYKPNGFFGWTSSFKVYAPSKDQPSVVRTVAEYNEHEKHIYEFFADEANIGKLIEFWCLEEKKGQDKFNRYKFQLIRKLFSAFGLKFLDSFLVKLKELIENKSNENHHRCASEILGGIIKGAKHWNYENTKNMYEKLTPLIKLALNNITNETDTFWGTCFATAALGMDPKKQYWLYETLLEEPIQESTSFTDCSRLYCLQGAFNQQVCRLNSVAFRLLEILRPYLHHPFQIVRERIGSTLINVFEADLSFQNGITGAPDKIAFLKEVLVELQPLVEKDNIVEKDKLLNDPGVRLFKTISQWLTGLINRCTNTCETIFYEFLPIACRLENFQEDGESVEISSGLLAIISQALVLPNNIDACLTKIEEISYSTYWSTRQSIIDILQVTVFHNMQIFLSKLEWIERIQAIVLRLMEDQVLEVREKAAEVLGGLLHCSFLPATDKLLELFKKKCRTKVIKRSAYVDEAASCSVQEKNSETNDIRKRHSGVLGLCAFVNAFPFSIPDFVPKVFEHLNDNLNDPQPIPETIRKTLADFKRTHMSSEIKVKFTDVQLQILEHLVVPPSYYA